NYNVSDTYNVTTNTHSPLIENGTVSQLSAGWGDQWNFSVMVFDSSDNVTVQLWRSSLFVGQPWTLMSEANYTTPGSWGQINFSPQFTCSNIGLWYFKFNATDTVSNTNETTASANSNFTITQDSVIFELDQGDSSTANRSNSQTDNLTMIIRDGNGTVLAGFNVTFYVETNSFVYDSGTNITTNSSGYAIYEFDPTCSPTRYEVGVQNWKAETEGYTCYVDNSSAEYELTIRGDFNSSITDPTGDQNYTQGDTIIIQGAVRDDCNAEMSGVDVKFYLNGSTSYNCTDVSSPVTGFYRCDWDSTGQNYGYYNVSMTSNTSYYYYNETIRINQSAPGLFYLLGLPLLEDDDVYPDDEGWGWRDYNFSVNGSAGETEQEIVIKLYMKEPGGGSFVQYGSAQNCTGCIDQKFYWLRNFTSDQQGGWFYRFDLEVSGAPYTQTDDVYFFLYKDNITITHHSGNGSSVNRSGSQTTRLILFVNDTDRGEGRAYDPAATVNFNITADGTNYVLEGTNTSNTSGHVILDFNPDCSYDLGLQNWLGYTQSDSAYFDQNSSIFNVSVIGDLVANATAVNTSPMESDIVIIYVNLTDEQECSNPIAGATLNITLLRANYTFTCGGIQYNGDGNYSCNWTSNIGDPVGWYSVNVVSSMNSSYNNGNDTIPNVFQLTPFSNINPTLENPTVSPGGWGEAINFTVQAYDINTENVTVELWESPNDSDPWTLRQTIICIDCNPTQTLNFSVYHTCPQVGTMYYKFNATDTFSGNNETLSYSFTIEPDNVTIQYVQGNFSDVNRSGSQFPIPYVMIRVYDDDNQSYAMNNSNITFWFAYNDSAWDSGWNTTTNSSGYANASFNPDCSYSRNAQRWTGGTYADQCYESQNLTLDYNITIHGDLQGSITNVTCPGGGN
ncbi:MAG: Ig-like domain-containing protein, partial [Candidatus Thorarchaeota archaeon]